MKISSEVEGVLRYSREARNSDKELTIRMMDKYGMDLSPHQKQVFRDMPAMETIRRIRQKLQSEGKYTSDQVISRERKYKSFRMQQMNPKAEKIETITEPRAVSWLDGDKLG